MLLLRLLVVLLLATQLASEPDFPIYLEKVLQETFGVAKGGQLMKKVKEQATGENNPNITKQNQNQKNQTKPIPPDFPLKPGRPEHKPYLLFFPPTHPPKTRPSIEPKKEEEDKGTLILVIVMAIFILAAGTAFIIIVIRIRVMSKYQLGKALAQNPKAELHQKFAVKPCKKKDPIGPDETEISDMTEVYAGSEMSIDSIRNAQGPSLEGKMKKSTEARKKFSQIQPSLHVPSEGILKPFQRLLPDLKEKSNEKE